MRKLLDSGMAWLLLSIIILVLDRYSKMWMMEHLMLGEPVTILPVLNLTLAYNTGAAFSLLHTASGWQQYFLGGLAVCISILILGYLLNAPRSERWQNAALSMILAGAMGNAWDRALYGHVIDFINFHLGGWHFAIFNIADSAICIGAFLLIMVWVMPSCAREKHVH